MDVFHHLSSSKILSLDQGFGSADRFSLSMCDVWTFRTAGQSGPCRFCMFDESTECWWVFVYFLIVFFEFLRIKMFDDICMSWHTSKKVPEDVVEIVRSDSINFILKS